MDEDDQFLRAGKKPASHTRPIDIAIVLLLVSNLVLTIAIGAYVFVKVSNAEENLTTQVQTTIQNYVNSVSAYLTLIPNDIPQLFNYALHSNYTSTVQSISNQLRRVITVANNSQLVDPMFNNIITTLNTTIQVMDLIASIPPIAADPSAANYTPSNWISGIIADVLNSSVSAVNINNTALQQASLACVELGYSLQSVNWTYSFYENYYYYNYSNGNYTYKSWWEPINHTPQVCSFTNRVIQACSSIFNNTIQYAPTSQTLPSVPASSLCGCQAFTDCESCLNTEYCTWCNSGSFCAPTNSLYPHVCNATNICFYDHSGSGYYDF